mmetsp:Transcript_27507/g.70701  ORF Transcript_27507/g.70701 Transcript_27507/m.70701 type:complete len:288 (-) Transcript_27507:454-1317(-)
MRPSSALLKRHGWKLSACGKILVSKLTATCETAIYVLAGTQYLSSLPQENSKPAGVMTLRIAPRVCAVRRHASEMQQPRCSKLSSRTSRAPTSALNALLRAACWLGDRSSDASNLARVSLSSTNAASSVSMRWMSAGCSSTMSSVWPAPMAGFLCAAKSRLMTIWAAALGVIGPVHALSSVAPLQAMYSFQPGSSDKSVPRSSVSHTPSIVSWLTSTQSSASAAASLSACSHSREMAAASLAVSVFRSRAIGASLSGRASALGSTAVAAIASSSLSWKCMYSSIKAG